MKMNQAHHLLTKVRQSAHDFLAQAGVINFQCSEEEHLLCRQLQVLQALTIH